MTIVRQGSAVHSCSDWLGPAPWRVVTRAAAEVGLVLSERGRGGVRGTFTDGWLRLEDAGDEVAAALQRGIARAGGRDVARSAWRVEARVRAGAVEVDGAIARSSVAGNGEVRWEAPRRVALPVETEVDALEEDVLTELLADAEGAWIALTRVLEGPLAHLHPELRWRDVCLVVPSGWAPPSGADVELASGARVPGHVVSATLRGLGSALDDQATAPDLGRWGLRAARRAGLDAAPAPSHPDWARYQAIWLDLTAADRARPSPPGKVAAWRFRVPGTWIVPPADCARLRPLAPDHAAWRAALELGAAGSGAPIRVRASDAPEAPWALDPVELHESDGVLRVRVGEHPVAEARRDEGGVEVTWTDGIEPEVAASQLRAALRA